MPYLDLDSLLDRITAEAELAAGVPPGQVAAEYPAVSVSDDFAFVVRKRKRKRLPWSPAQDNIIRQWFGRVSRAELTRRVNEVLQRELMDDTIKRSPVAVALRAGAIGVPAYTGDEAEVCIAQAARELKISHSLLHQALQRGELAAQRTGKQRYINRRDLSIWFVAFRERQLAQAEILNALDGNELCSKQEAMKLTGLRETQMTRYLATGVITAWKIPDLTLKGERGEWQVERQSAEQMRTARKKGRRAVRELWTEAYHQLQQQSNAEVERLRQNNPTFGQPDPLITPKSKYLPGCYTVAQVASHTQQLTKTVYAAIKTGQVEALTTKGGGRQRYAITPTEARRYARAMRNDAVR
jgi:hypothetical protein